MIKNSERIKLIIKIYATLFITSLIMYRNIYVSILLGMCSFLIYKKFERNLIKKKKKLILSEFKEYLYFILGALESGEVFENAMVSACFELEKVYDLDSFIVSEARKLKNNLDCGIELKDALVSMREDFDIDIISTFVDLIILSLNSGGNINALVRHAITIINEREELSKEIDVLYLDKKFEFSIMSIFPFVILLLLSFTAGDFILPLYKDALGYVILTGSYLITIAAYLIGDGMLEDGFD